jgi:hypothetical protein
MTTFRVTGHVDADGELRMKLPPGEVEVAVTLPDAGEPEEPPRTDEEAWR